jgi:hypothetical protein
MGLNALKNEYYWWGFDLLLVLVIRAEGDPHQDNSCLAAFSLVRQGDGYCKWRETVKKTCIVRRTLDSVLIYMRRHSFPSTTLITILHPPDTRL